MVEPRIQYARPGQILTAAVVRQLAGGKQFLFSDLSETELRWEAAES